MCDLYDLEPCTVWRETPRTARKQHRCDGCGAFIRPGEVYLAHFNVFEGEASNEKACFACWWALEDFGNHHGQRMAPANLSWMLSDCYGGEGRGYWTDEDRLWRRYHAALLKRTRAARRPAGALQEEG